LNNPNSTYTHKGSTSCSKSPGKNWENPAEQKAQLQNGNLKFCPQRDEPQQSQQISTLLKDKKALEQFM
jgi:hypothetical protein